MARKLAEAGLHLILVARHRNALERLAGSLPINTASRLGYSRRTLLVTTLCGSEGFELPAGTVDP